VNELVRRGSESLPVLLAALDRRDVELRRRALLVLQHIGGPGIEFDPFAPEQQRRHQLAALYARFNVRPV
jgi:hypothetical protein